MIVAEKLTKHHGDRVAVDDLSFAVRPGVVTGFLGPNGAGKSTTMRLVLGLDAPTPTGVRIRRRATVTGALALGERGADSRGWSDDAAPRHGQQEVLVDIVVVLGVLVVLLAAALVWGARRSRDADEDIKYMNEGRGVGRGILGVFGSGKSRP